MQINANLQSKARDPNKCEEHSSKLVHKSLRIQRKILFENKHKVTIKKRNL